MNTLKHTPHFTERRIVTGSNKLRIIGEPDQEARDAHAELLGQINSAPIEFPHATGSIQGRSLISNIEPHIPSLKFYKLDLKDAFPNTDGERLARALSLRGIFRHRRAAYDWLKEFALDDGGGLVLGGPASPALFNIACLEMDKEIGELCRQNGLVYTRYVDDLTISGMRGKEVGDFMLFPFPGGKDTLGQKRRRAIRHTIEEHGWEVNHRKSMVHDLVRGPVTITGVSIYFDITKRGREGFRYQLSPPLIEKIKAVHQEMRDKLKRGEPLDEKDIAKLHGYNGIVTSMHDPKKPFSHVEKYLIREYRKLLRRNPTQPQIVGSEAVQLSFFDGIDVLQ